MKRKKCYIYKRVSTAAQIEGYSLEAQTERLQGYAAYKELEIAGEYCDAGKSGGSIKGRPQFIQMMDDIAEQKDGISFVLVFKLSRFGRNAADVLKSMQHLMDYGVDLVSVEDAIDSSTQGGRLTISILAAVAEIEKENITVQFMAGRMQKVCNGGWPGGPAPYGYRNVKKRMVPEPGEAQIIKLIYDLYLREGMMATSVAAYLNAHGFTKKVKGADRPFTYDMVAHILDNPFYCGEIHYNRRRNRSAAVEQKDVRVIRGSHEALVPKEQWEAVQSKRELYRGSSQKTEDPERVSLLSGLVKCPECGCGMIVKKNKSINHNRGGHYKTLYYYCCRNNQKQNGRVCGFSHTYNQEKVDNAVLEIVGRVAALPEFRERVLRQLADHDTVERLEADMKNLRKRIRSEEMRKRKLGGAMDTLDILDEEYDREYGRLQSEMDAVYDRIEGMERELAGKQKRLLEAGRGIRSADKITALLDHMKELYGRMNCEERRKLYRLLIDRIEVYPEHPDGRIIRSISFQFPVYYGEMEEGRAPDDRILFTLDCGGQELTASEAKATYAQIKSYILENSGMKVSALYIAQTKRKYGLDMGPNYNAAKDPEARVPKCPEKKEALIVEALKHYKMLDASVELKPG